MQHQNVTQSEPFVAVWHALAYERVRYLAATMPAFCADEIWAVLDALPTPEDPRALGPVMKRAQKDGLIKPSSMTTPSHRVVCHSRPTNIWLSVPLCATITQAAEYATTRLGTKPIVAPTFDFAGSMG